MSILFTAGVDVVIKAQALTGGRGLGSFKNGFKGGVHMCTKYVHIFSSLRVIPNLLYKV